MNNTGTVIKVDGNTLSVKIDRKSPCSSCSANCDGNCAHEIVLAESAKTFTLKAQNTVGAELGDVVEVYQEGGNPLLYAFAVFFLPVAVAAVVYVLCAVFASRTVSVSVAAVSFVLSFLLSVYLSGKSADKNVRIYTRRIIRKGT